MRRGIENKITPASTDIKTYLSLIQLFYSFCTYFTIVELSEVIPDPLADLQINGYQAEDGRLPDCTLLVIISLEDRKYYTHTSQRMGPK